MPSPRPTPAVDAARSPIALGRRFYQIAVARLAEVQEPLGLSPLEFGVLIRLHDAPGLDQVTLGERMVLDRTTAGGLVHHLESLGLVERAINGQDRRARVLRLTPAGKVLHDEQRPNVMAAQARMLETLAPTERRTLLDLLVRVVDANKAYMRPGAGRRRARPRAMPDNATRRKQKR